MGIFIQGLVRLKKIFEIVKVIKERLEQELKQIVKRLIIQVVDSVYQRGESFIVDNQLRQVWVQFGVGVVLLYIFQGGE